MGYNISRYTKPARLIKSWKEYLTCTEWLKITNEFLITLLKNNLHSILIVFIRFISVMFSIIVTNRIVQTGEGSIGAHYVGSALLRWDQRFDWMRRKFGFIVRATIKVIYRPRFRGFTWTGIRTRDHLVVGRVLYRRAISPPTSFIGCSNDVILLNSSLVF